MKEEVKKEFKNQIVNNNLRDLQKLKNYPDLCKFYKDNFDEFSGLIKSQGAKLAIDKMEIKGMPIKEEISFFRQFIQNINNAIKNGDIKESDL